MLDHRFGLFAILLFVEPAFSFAERWQPILEMKGKANEQSQAFELTGSEVVSWAYAGKHAAYLSVTIVGSENHLVVNRLDRTESQTTELKLPAGRYHLDVRSAGCTWALSILRTAEVELPEQPWLAARKSPRPGAGQRRSAGQEQTRLCNAAIYRWKNSNPPPRRERFEGEPREWFSASGAFIAEGVLVGVTEEKIKIRRDDQRNPRIRTYGSFPHFIEIERSKLSKLSDSVAERVYRKVRAYEAAYAKWQQESAAAKQKIVETFVVSEEDDKVSI